MRLRSILLTLALAGSTWLTASGATSVTHRPTLDAVLAGLPAAAEIPSRFLAAPTGTLTVRIAPNAAAAPIAAAPPGPVIVTGQEAVADGVVWREVVTDAGLGWVEARRLGSGDQAAPDVRY